MTYHLNPELRKIESPVRVICPGEEDIDFRDGSELVEHSFDKHFIVQNIKAQ